jgi:hypothetical protein
MPRKKPKTSINFRGAGSSRAQDECEGGRSEGFVGGGEAVNVQKEAVEGGGNEVEGGDEEETGAEGRVQEGGNESSRDSGLAKKAGYGQSHKDDEGGLHDAGVSEFGPGYHEDMNNMEEDISIHGAGEEGETEHGFNGDNCHDVVGDGIGGNVATVGELNADSIDASNRGGENIGDDDGGVPDVGENDVDEFFSCDGDDDLRDIEMSMFLNRVTLTTMMLLWRRWMLRWINCCPGLICSRKATLIQITKTSNLRVI